MVTSRRRSGSSFTDVTQVFTNWYSFMVTILAIVVTGGLIATSIITLLIYVGPIWVGNARFASRAAYAETGPFSEDYTCAASGTCVLNTATRTVLGLDGVTPQTDFTTSGDLVLFDSSRSNFEVLMPQPYVSIQNISGVGSIATLTEIPYQPNNYQFTYGQIRKTYLMAYITINGTSPTITLPALTPTPSPRPQNLWYSAGSFTCEQRGSWAPGAFAKVAGIAYSSEVDGTRVFSINMPTTGPIVCAGLLTEYVQTMTYP